MPGEGRRSKKAMGTDLPEDVLADVLRRLAPRGIAACRCVCKAWHALADGHPLLRAGLLPRSLAGVLINFHGLFTTEFFSRPSKDTDSPFIFSEHGAAGHAGYYRPPPAVVQDHCNGLVLIRGEQLRVVNPATRWRAHLPPTPPPRVDLGSSFDVARLVYDPTISPHYEVFLFPRFCLRRDPEDFPPCSYDPMVEEGEDCFPPCSWADEHDPMVEQSEWPPSPCVLRVFSSKTERWEERSFIREGKAAGTIADMRLDQPHLGLNAVYWREALYVHFQTHFVMRISLSTNKLQVVKPPVPFQEDERLGLHLGKSEKGVYFASVYGRCELKVWFLDESCCPMEWVLKHQADLTGWVLKHNIKQVCGPWRLHDINHHYSRAPKTNYNKDDDIEEHAEEIFEWDSEDEKLESYANKNEDTGLQRHYHGYIDILGFHAYKEIIFLGEHLRRGLAYHLSSTKVEDLGNLYPTRYGEVPNEEFIEQCFPYTPSWIIGPTKEKSFESEGQVKN